MNPKKHPCGTARKPRHLDCIAGLKVVKRPSGLSHLKTKPKLFPPMTLTGEQRIQGNQLQYQCERGGRAEWIQMTRLILATPENSLMESES